MRRSTPSPPRWWGRGPAATALLTAVCAVGAPLALLACAVTGTGANTQIAAEESPGQNPDDDAATASETRSPDIEDEDAASIGEAVSSSEDGVIFLSGREGPDAGAHTTLVAAAADARAQRAAAGPPLATITDENRERRAARGSLTFVNDSGSEAAASGEVDSEAGAQGAPGSAAAEPAAAATGATAPTEESYWRTTVRKARMRWRDSVRRLDELRGDVAGLRNAYYATDDPHYREGVLKPDWDAAAGDLEAAEAEVVAAREDLRHRLDAGRRAGALPGWLREGLELEPDPPRARDTERSIVEPIEPPMAEEEPRR